MKQFFLWSAIICVSVAACSKSGSSSACTPVEPATEDAAIVAYNTAHGITATKLASGLYYQIVDPGVGAVPKPTSNIRVNYAGKRISNDSTFDSNQSFNGAQLNMGGVIAGWTEGLSLIKSGGTIRLTIPSKLAYGCMASGNVIPANSPLFFEIKLLAVF